MSAAASSSSPARPFRSAWTVAADLLDPPAWQPVERPDLEAHQIPPAKDWTLWLLEGGRGCGKTEACSRYFARWMREHPGHRGRIIAPTFGDAVESCIEGPSGLRSVDPDVNWLPSAAGGAKVIWPNGSEALVLGTPFPRDVDRLRAGGNRHCDWWEEMAANAQLRKAWDQAQFGLRLGEHPHSIGSTTPRVTLDYAGSADPEEWAGVRNLPGVALTHATMFDNPHNPPEWVARMRARYEGTTLGQQELLGLLLRDVEGALWKRSHIDRHRVSEIPDLVRVVVSIDPAVTSGDDADDTGIVVAGLGANGHGYVLADRSCHLPPDQWAKRALASYEEFDADRVVAEVNNGGDLVETVLRTQDERVPFKALRATRGKRTRAEPIAALYEQGKVHHVGMFAKLEDEQCMPAGTLVTTRRGDVAIERVSSGDEVLTRIGWKPVRWAGQTGVAECVQISLADGRQLRCTGAHPVWVCGRGFLPAAEVQSGHRCLSPLRENSSNIGASSTSAPGSLLGSNTGTRRASKRTAASQSSFIASSMKRRMAPFPPGGTSTIATATGSTMPSATSWRPALQTTRQRTRHGASATKRAPSAARAEPRSGAAGNPALGDASHAAANSSAPVSEPCFAPLGVVAVTTASSGATEPVYNLTVADQPEFFANGVLVHNCTWLPGEPSPDRMDAAVWALTDLMLTGGPGQLLIPSRGATVRRSAGFRR